MCPQRPGLGPGGCLVAGLAERAGADNLSPEVGADGAVVTGLEDDNGESHDRTDRGEHDKRVSPE